MPTTPARRSAGGWRGMRAFGRHRTGASPRPACEASGAADSTARIQLPIYRQEDRRPPSARAIPSATVLGRFSMSEGFHHFDIEEAKVQSPIRMLKHFHRVRFYTCMSKRPWPRSFLKPKEESCRCSPLLESLYMEAILCELEELLLANLNLSALQGFRLEII